MFLCWRGHFRVEFRDGAVELDPGDFVVVPRGVEHRPVADTEAEVMLFVPVGLRNPAIRDAVFTAPTGVPSEAGRRMGLPPMERVLPLCAERTDSRQKRGAYNDRSSSRFSNARSREPTR